MIRLGLALLVWLMASAATATTYWVTNAGGAASCAAASGDTDPGAYRTKVQGVNCLAAGDTLMVKSGEVITTTTGGDIFNEFGNTPAGLGPTQRTKILCQGDQTCTIRPSSMAGSGAVIGIRARSYIQIGERGQGFIFDAINGSASSTNPVQGIRLYQTDMTADAVGGVIRGNRVINYNAFGISSNGVYPLGWKNMDWSYNFVGKRRTPTFQSSASHAIYLTGTDNYIHHNDVYAFNDGTSGGSSYGLHCWHFCRRNTWEYNHVNVEGLLAAGFISGGPHGAENDHVVRYNTFKRIGANPGTCLDTLNTGDNIIFEHNTCDGFAELLENNIGTTGTILRNNICTSTATCVIDNPGGGLTQSGNILNVATSNFTDPSSNNYTLKSTAATLIDQGVNVGKPFNGSAPDVGAHESFLCTSSTINTNLLDLTCGMSLNAPVRLTSGTTGWSVGCTGTGCGTPTVGSVSVTGGSSSIIRLAVNGITGTDCQVGQTWTITYNSATGTVTDTVGIGGTKHQPLGSITAQAVTNACSGTGGGPPAGLHVYHKFDGDALDSSGNALHASVTGTAYVAGKYGSGLQTNVGENDYAQLVYGNAVNPSTQSLTIAGGVYVDPTDTAGTRAVFGSPLSGTNQRLYIARQVSTWRMGVQAYSAGNASEFTVQPGWNHVVLTLNSATDTATLCVNGVTGTSTGAVHAYTSYTTTGDFRIGLPSGFSATSGGAHVFDEWAVWTSVESCAAIYAAWEPPVTPSTGTLAVAASRAYSAKTQSGSRLARAAVNTASNTSIDGAVAVLFQTDCTVADCSQISERLFYTCAACPSAGSELTVPDTATADGVKFYGLTQEVGVLTGDHGALLSGALSRIDGGTNTTADGVPVFDLAQNQSIVNGYVVQFSGATAGRTYCFYPKEQSGLALSSYAPAGGLCITTQTPSASTGY